MRCDEAYLIGLAYLVFDLAVALFLCLQNGLAVASGRSLV
jgi:hypothetical protein